MGWTAVADGDRTKGTPDNLVGVMSFEHPITQIAESLGRITSQCEPGTSFYEQVVGSTRNKVHEAQTRDDLEGIVVDLKEMLSPHFTDDQMKEFHKILDSMQEIGSGWPVDAFKQGYQKGTGEQLPDEG